MALPQDDRPASTPDAAERPMPQLPPELGPSPSIRPADTAPSAAGAEPLGKSMPPAADVEPFGQTAPPVAAVEPLGETAPPAAGVEPPGGTAPARREPVRVPRTRTSAVWFGVWAGVVTVILLIIFVGQNTASVEINFLWMSGSIPLALALLIAGVGGAIIAMAVSAARIIQLRRHFRRTRT
jgi:uncharacterized integral membrane protein